MLLKIIVNKSFKKAISYIFLMTSFIDERGDKFYYDSRVRESPHAARKRLKDGELMAWDGHAHSFYSRDVKERPEFNPVSIFFAGLKRGMSYVTITDHNEYTQNEIVAETLKNRPELLRKFVPGTEFTLNDKNLGHVIHVNVYRLTRKDFEKLKMLKEDVVLFVGYCARNKLMFQYNHPLWFEMDQERSISEKNFTAILKYGKLFPVIEVSNSNRALYENLAGEFLAKLLGKGMTSSSDGHFGDAGLSGYTLARGKNFREFWSNVVSGNAYLVKQNLKPETLRGYALDTVDQIAFQTKIKKVGERYMMETGNKKLKALISFFDRFPWLLRPITPYVKYKIRMSSLIEEYLENQNVIGRKAIEYFRTRALTKPNEIAVKTCDLTGGK